MTTYKRLPVAFESGEGSWLIDDKGERYLDALSGISVCNIGHSNPDLIRSIKSLVKLKDSQNTITPFSQRRAQLRALQTIVLIQMTPYRFALNKLTLAYRILKRPMPDHTGKTNGEIKYSNGSVYFGEMKDFIRHGQGKLKTHLKHKCWVL